MATINHSGLVTLLRVNEQGDRFGSSGDQITAEVIVQLDGAASPTFGFRMLDDADRLVRRGYLDLLRDALNHGHVVNLDADFDEGSTKGQIVRVWLTPAPRKRPVESPRFPVDDLIKGAS